MGGMESCRGGWRPFNFMICFHVCQGISKGPACGNHVLRKVRNTKYLNGYKEHGVSPGMYENIENYCKMVPYNSHLERPIAVEIG